MKAITAIGIGVAFAGLFLGMIMEGGNPAGLINIPAALIVLVGTLGVTIASCSMEQTKAIPGLYKLVISGEKPDLKGRVKMMVGYAERARRDGLLALEDEVEELEDEFAKKGLQLVVDGTDPELIREILETEIEAMETRHHDSVQPFEKAGGFAPTLGVLGTVMGLVHVLENLDKPETLGPLIAGAFIATLYGVGSANVIFLPVCYRLKAMSREEAELRYMTLEGILSIQAGDNPRVVESKLISFVPPAERLDDESPKAGAAAPSGAEAAQAAA